MVHKEWCVIKRQEGEEMSKCNYKAKGDLSKHVRSLDTKQVLRAV